ncbi:hypothetical protein C8J56DRAFT_1065287 [Mycena floridula]|nr:hypothetical protein C8J56DRAFT_1065287 [Mycena floridula]
MSISSTHEDPPTSWKSLSDAKSGCLALVASPDKAKSMKSLSFDIVAGLNGCEPDEDQKNDIDFVLRTVKHLPSLVELSLNDSPYNWIPKNWLETKLEKLVVHDPDEAIDTLLVSQPSIRYLEFWSLQNPMELPGIALPHVLPVLEHVAGYPEVIHHYVPGRPVHTIRAPMIANIALIDDILATAQKSTVNLTTLDVAVSEEQRSNAVNTIITGLGDSLTTITVRYHKGKKIDSPEAFNVLQDDWIAGLANATALNSFTPLLWFSDFEVDESAVARRLAQICKSLRKFHLRKRWILSESQGWVEAQ